MKSYGECLRIARHERGISQMKLSEISGVWTSAIDKIERGITANPRIATIEALAKALDMTIDELLNK